jgi:hypothetical protein
LYLVCAEDCPTKFLLANILIELFVAYKLAGADPACKPRGAAAPTQFLLSLQYAMPNCDLPLLKKENCSN